MVISHMPQLMVKSSPFEQATSEPPIHSFLQPSVPKKQTFVCSKVADSWSPQSINIEMIEEEENEHEVIE
jgi:hypothetical protein